MTYTDPETVPPVWQIGDVILDRYEVQQIFTSGGIVLVYRVHDRGWGMALAVKSPRPEFLKTAEQIESFEREAETWVNLGLHPHIVSCYYVRRLGGIPRIFAEFVEGGTLADWIRSRKLYKGGRDQSLRSILDVAIQFAWGLHYAHEKGLVHQDVKPGNVLMAKDGTAKVSDFGLASARRVSADDTAVAARPGQNILVPGSGFMTPAYASPEQLRGEALSRETDVWSWAVSLLEMLVGEVTWASGLAAPAVLEQLDDGQIGDDLRDLLGSCFGTSTKARLTSFVPVLESLMRCYKSRFGEYDRCQPDEVRLSSDALNNKGVSLLDIGRMEEGCEALQCALNVNPRNTHAKFNLLVTEWRQARISDEQVIQELWSIRDAGNSKELDLLLSHVCSESGNPNPIEQPITTADELLLPKGKHLDSHTAPIVLVSICKIEGALFSLSVSQQGCVLMESISDRKQMRVELGKWIAECAMTATWSQIVFATVTKAVPQDQVHLHVFDTKKKVIKKTVLAHRGDVSCLSMLDSEQLLTSGSDGHIRVWRVADLRLIQDFDLSTKEAIALASKYGPFATHNGRTLTQAYGAERIPNSSLVAICHEGQIRIWETEDVSDAKTSVAKTRGFFARFGIGQSSTKPSQWLTMLVLRGDSYSGKLAVSPDGECIAAGGRLIHLWSLDGTLKAKLAYAGRTFAHLQFSSDSRFLFGAGSDPDGKAGAIIMWDAKTGRRVRTCKLTEPFQREGAFAVDERSGLMCVGQEDGSLFVTSVALPRPSGFLSVARPTSLVEVQAKDSKHQEALIASERAFDQREYQNSRDARLQKIQATRQHVVSSVRESGWDAVSDSLAEMLWTLAELRSDFEELPSWILDAKASGVFDSSADNGGTVSEKVFALLRSAVNRYGSDADRVSVSRMKSAFLSGRDAIQSDKLAVFTADIALHLAQARLGCLRLPLAIHDDQLLVGRHTCVSFNRTLRVPEDGKKYPLPAGFGRLPILRVEDYAEQVPEKWLEQGGFIIPLYQREALFLEFAGVDWRPTIAKVSVGRINAITGQEHDLKLRPHRQDYVVVPEQRWLDGINSGDGLVSQFVAMPLGQGYTIEAQMTDEEEHGGFQIVVFDPRAGRFPEHDPKKVISASAARKARRLRAAQAELLKSIPPLEKSVIQALQKQHPEDAAKRLGMHVDQIGSIIQNLRVHFENLLGEDGFKGVIPNLPRMATDAVMSKRAVALSDDERISLGASLPFEMGIAAGGSIEQQILEDTYGAESWDETAFREIAIHIVNSEMYERITGMEAPETPISADDYRQYGIPWFSDYQEETPSLAPGALLRRVRSIEQIDKSRGIKVEKSRSETPLHPEVILRIQTPTFRERYLALVERAERSMEAGRHSIAIREASLALDLVRTDDDFSDDKFAPLLVRAQAHRSLGNEADAEADASECLELRPDDIDALAIRAMASLHLGEHLLARNDAERILEANPNSKDALFVIAQAELKLSGEAQSDRSRMKRNAGSPLKPPPMI